MRIALWSRYSSKMQDPLSIEAQTAEMEAFCSKRGWTVTHRFELPETRSDDVEQAEEYQAMMRAARAKEFDMLLLHALDRLGRDRQTSMLTKLELRKRGIRVFSVKEQLNGEDPQDILLESILEGVAEYYKHNLGAETRKGHAQLTRTGLFRGGKAPFGYRAVEEPAAEGRKAHKRLEPCPVNAPTMKTIFEMVAGGQRTSDVRAWAKQATGQSWTHQTLYERIRNPVYYGRLEFGKTRLVKGHRSQQPAEALVTGQVEAIVSEELWQRANAAITTRGAAHSQKRRPNRTYLLSEGTMTCAVCGRSMTGCQMDGPRYVCSGRKNEQCRVRNTVPAEKLEALVFRFFAEELKKFDVAGFMENYRRHRQPELDEAKRREAALRKELADVVRKQKNLLEMAEDGGATAALRHRLKELSAQESALAAQIATCQLQADRTLQGELSLVETHLTSLADLVPHATPEELKRLYALNLRVEFDAEKQTGTVRLRLSPDHPQDLELELPRKSAGRSARTTLCPREEWLSLGAL